MHKDCIILCNQKEEDNSLTCLKKFGDKTFLEILTAYLSTYHICKIIFSISSNQTTFKNYILDNRDKFSFAFDFAEQDNFVGSGSAILHALQYSDTPDVLILPGHKFFNINIDDLIAWQQTKLGDVTLALTYQEDNPTALFAHLNEEHIVSEFTKGNNLRPGLFVSEIYCLFRPSFLNINFPNAFSFENDYLQAKLKERDFIGVVMDNDYFDLRKSHDIENFELFLAAKKPSNQSS